MVVDSGNKERNVHSRGKKWISRINGRLNVETENKECQKWTENWTSVGKWLVHDRSIELEADLEGSKRVSFYFAFSLYIHMFLSKLAGSYFAYWLYLDCLTGTGHRPLEKEQFQNIPIGSSWCIGTSWKILDQMTSEVVPTFGIWNCNLDRLNNSLGAMWQV